MSTQSISKNNICSLQKDTDEALLCIADKLTLSKKFGFKFDTNSSDIFKLSYVSGILNEDRNTEFLYESRCAFEGISKYINKVK